MAREAAIGIDLGTTNSAVAWVDDSGRTTMVSNSEGDLLTPSIVMFNDNEVVVGKDARSATAVHPDLVAEWVKRDMGAPAYSHPIHGKFLPPEVIQACILRKLRNDVVRRVGDSARVVITVPAYFDEPRRKATADAGEMAGLRVLDIVNEPTAAALSYGEALGYLSRQGEPKQEMTVLVYDLGGGTFDATLLRLSSGNVHTIATDGDVQLGGHDWDNRLVNHIAEHFVQAHGIDPRHDPGGLARLYTVAIEAKLTLSARTRTTIRFDHEGKSLDLQLTREQFEEMAADLLQRTAYTTRQLIAAANLRWSDVSRVLLVGGATRMPMVTSMLCEMTGITPDRTVNPDEAVARGAALYAHYLLDKLSNDGKAPAFEVTNVNSHSLGVEGIDQGTMRKTNVILIPRNTSLPAKVTERFVTKMENQRSIVLQVLEGESSLPEECTAIGRTAIRDLPAGLSKGWPVEVTFEYAANGRLSVQAVVPGTHQEARLDIERATGLSHSGIAQWRPAVEQAAGFNRFDALIDEVLAVPAAKSGSAAQSADPAGLVPIDQPPTTQVPTAQVTTAQVPTAQASASQAAATRAPVAQASMGQATGSVPTAVSVPVSSPPPPAPSQSIPTEHHTSAPRVKVAPEAPDREAIRWTVLVVGYILSAAMGLGLGYLVLHILKPESFPAPW